MSPSSEALNAQEAIQERVKGKLQDIKNHLKDTAVDKSAKEELAKCIVLLLRIRKLPEPDTTLDVMDTAISILLEREPNVGLAKAIRECIQQEVSPTFFHRSRTPAGSVTSGLAVLFFVAVALLGIVISAVNFFKISPS